MLIQAKGKVTALVGGQWGSEAKGAIASYCASTMDFNLAITNAGAQAGHTYVDMVERAAVPGSDGKHVCYHLPVATALTMGDIPAFITAGAIIDPDLFLEELLDNQVPRAAVRIHPRAAVISPMCKALEQGEDSVNTRIASTQKGVGHALSLKVRRRLDLAADCPKLAEFISDLDLSWHLLENNHALFMEVPQGFDLSLNHGSHYPHCTSRDCYVTAALSDAGLHPSFLGTTIMVVRTFPIRVGNIVKDGHTLGDSGGYYDDQQEISFEDIDQQVEITTVTKRPRRLFTFSQDQYSRALAHNRPNVVALTFCNYCTPAQLEDILGMMENAHGALRLFPHVLYQYGPGHDDVTSELDIAFSHTR